MLYRFLLWLHRAEFAFGQAILQLNTGLHTVRNNSSFEFDIRQGIVIPASHAHGHACSSCTRPVLLAPLLRIKHVEV